MVPTRAKIGPNMAPNINNFWSCGLAGPPLKHVNTGILMLYIKTHWSDTPGHRQRCGGFSALRACHRPRDGDDDDAFRFFLKFFREFQNLKIEDQAGARNFIKKSSKSEPSSRFFGRLKILAIFPGEAFGPGFSFSGPKELGDQSWF